MTLKEMIEEARMMAETPDLDNIRSSPETNVQDSEFSSRKSSISQGIMPIQIVFKWIYYNFNFLCQKPNSFIFF